MPLRLSIVAISTAASVLQFAGSCTARETARGSENPQPQQTANSGGEHERGAFRSEARSESPALCRITEGNEAAAKARLPLQFRVGELAFHAERRTLLCSEPAGLRGDCQVIGGSTVIVARAGRPDIRVEAIAAAPYLAYGPDGVRCSPPPPPVRR